jgi:hypothetical protein
MIIGLFLAILIYFYNKLLKDFLPIYKNSKKTNIFRLLSNFILINTNFGYRQIANFCLTMYYSLSVYRNGMKHELIKKIQGIGEVLVLLYYIKQSIDIFYIKKEKQLEDIKAH